MLKSAIFGTAAVLGQSRTTVKEFEFGRISLGSGFQSVRGFELENDFITCTVLSYGVTFQKILVRDRTSIFDDILMGFDNIDDYLKNNDYVGGLLGRYANRIGGASFTLYGQTYNLNPTSWDTNHIHGGTFGFDKVVWAGNVLTNGVEFFHSSPDGDEGYPGKLDTIVTIRLDGHEIDVTYESRTDKPTHVNLSHHWFFNMNGHMNWGLVDDLKLIVPSEDYLETDEENIPTGRVLPVSRSPFDLREGHFLTQGLLESVPGGHGIDICYTFPKDGKLKQMAVLAAPYTGRLLELKSTNPGLQVYTANWVPDTVGKYNIPYGKHTAVALEPQFWPDSPNHPQFPSTLLLPGQYYKQQTKMAFYRI
ncbi:unnamed protein product [Oikopleura dioica]|uniref:Aldose 1-epimerase n=1 Tax=Oikopleura dioica TaxID=34765 RepID=E4Y6L4_OIKDI|nr:unnamed protein product [Oikopleura dioica]